MHEKDKDWSVFYGWFIVAACFAGTLTLGEAMWAFGVFFKPLENEFGWNRAMVSSAYTAFLFGYSISALSSGRLADRYSPRPILFVSALLAGLGVSLCSQVHHIIQLRAFMFIGGLGAGATWSVPTATVQRWFHHRPRSGLALGIVVSGVGIGGLIFAPLSDYLIITYGWRKTYLIVGILFFVVMALSSLVIKQSPRKNTVFEGVGDKRDQATTQGWTTAKAVATPAFAGMALANCIGIVTFQAVLAHLVPHATDVGISSTASAAALGLLGGFSVPGRIMSGLIADRLGWQRLLALSLFGMAFFIFWLSFLKGAWMLYTFVFFFGIFHGGRVSSYVGILGEFFGIQSLGELIGIGSAMAMIIGATAPYLAGSIYDTTGSYFTALMIVMALLLASGIITYAIKKPILPG